MFFKKSDLKNTDQFLNQRKIRSEKYISIFELEKNQI